MVIKFATDVPSGGTQELIRHGVNGLIIPAGDEKALENDANAHSFFQSLCASQNLRYKNQQFRTSLRLSLSH